jgi:hypothetical protein
MRSGTWRDAEDPVLFARWFRKRETWAQWFCFLKTLFGLPMSAGGLALDHLHEVIEGRACQ